MKICTAFFKPNDDIQVQCNQALNLLLKYNI